MHLDQRRLNELIVESQDLQSDAVRSAHESVPDLAEIHAERVARREEADPDQIAAFLQNRRGLLRKLGVGTAGGLAATTGLGAALLAIFAQPAAADTTLDVQILQTASSLERLAVNTYGAALGLDFIKNGNPVIVKFAETTMSQHDAHRQAFQAQTTALGGQAQDTPNPKYAPVVADATPTLKTPLDVVKLAATLEQVARDTYLSDLSMFSDSKSKEIMGSVMGVETQHLTVLRAVQALIDVPGAIAIPVDPNVLPAAAGSAPFPDLIPKATMASPPQEGAVK